MENARKLKGGAEDKNDKEEDGWPCIIGDIMFSHDRTRRATSQSRKATSGSAVGMTPSQCS